MRLTSVSRIVGASLALLLLLLGLGFVVLIDTSRVFWEE